MNKKPKIHIHAGTYFCYVRSDAIFLNCPVGQGISPVEAFNNWLSQS